MNRAASLGPSSEVAPICCCRAVICSRGSPGPAWGAKSMSEPESSRPVDTDRNLLFGVLALQADLLDRTQFVEGCAAWAARKTVPLSDLLVERGWLTTEARAAVEHLLEWTLKKHGDARNGLAATVDEEVRRSLQEIEDDAIRKSLVTVGEAHPGETVPADPAASERYPPRPPDDRRLRHAGWPVYCVAFSPR